MLHGGHFPPQSTPVSPASINPLEHGSTIGSFSLHPKKISIIVTTKVIRTFNGVWCLKVTHLYFL